jgi:phosphoenolpyruvate carboxylase
MQDLTTFAFAKIDKDLRFLLTCFAEVLTDLGQGELASALPWSDHELPARLPGRLGQAYSVAFQLLNLVEENVAAQTRRERERESGMAAEIACWSHALHRLVQEGFTQEQITEILPSICVEPVLTAHPTEAKRLTVLEQHRTLFRALGERENPALTPSEQDVIRERIMAGLERLWRTGEILLAKPEVADERRNVLHYLQEIFPDVLGRLDERLRQAWEDTELDLAILETHMPRLRFGTWVGGDRDGHPLVTAQVTANSLMELRLGALLVFNRALHGLAQKMSLSVYGQSPTLELEQGLKKLAEAAGARAVPILSRNEEEPWRQYVLLMNARLPLDTSMETPRLHVESGFYRQPDELRADLEVLRDSLEAAGAHRLVQSDLQPLFRALDTFGFHLADLDIRQNSEFHDRALEELMTAAGLEAKGYPQWPVEKKLTLLNEELKSPRPFLPPGARVEGEARAVLECLDVVAQHLERYDAAPGVSRGIGALIVSMTHTLPDLLAVYALGREAGLMLRTPGGLVCKLPVVPLFETVHDLATGAQVLKEFLQHPITQNSLRYQSGTGPLVQQVMVGYSDSMKDQGIFASQWALQSAQDAIATVGKEAGVEIRFFHGRGGTISRGAGPTHRFLDALPQGSLSGDIRLTEQGETIAQKFGNRATATYNLEVLMAGVLANTMRHRYLPKKPQPLLPLAEELAAVSGRAYTELLQSEGFPVFFRNATPIDVLEQSSIGSRPSRRTGQPSIADLRAIPWVFAWNQSRY